MEYRRINLVERTCMKITSKVDKFRTVKDNLRDVRPQSSLLGLENAWIL